MARKIGLGLSLFIEVVCMYLGCRMFYEMGILRDEYQIQGNQLFNYYELLLLFLLAVLSVITLVEFIRALKKNV